MIKQPTPLYKKEHVIVPGTRTIVEVHRTVTPDQLIDSMARGAAMEVRYGYNVVSPVPKEVTWKVTRVTHG